MSRSRFSISCHDWIRVSGGSEAIISRIYTETARLVTYIKQKHMLFDQIEGL